MKLFLFLFVAIIYGQIFFPIAFSATPSKFLYKASKIPIIKVMVGKNLKDVEIIGTDITRKNYLKKTLSNFDGRKKVYYSCSKYLGKESYRSESILLASLKSKTGLLSFDNKKYSGNLIVSLGPKEQRCDLINELSLEEYISLLLPKEMNGAWPVEALKAQAVAARTYALYKMGQRKSAASEDALFDLENSEKDQVNGTFFDLTPNALAAAKQTEGEILKTDDSEDITPIFFHAKCGGKTILPGQVWGNEVPGYVGVECKNCEKHADPYWTSKIEKIRMIKFFRWLIKQELIPEVDLSSMDKEQFMLAPDRYKNNSFRIYLGDSVFVLSKTWPRRYFGRVIFPSNNYYIKYDTEEFLITGRGNGHGVGMCQLGALDMAQKGMDYKKILAKYFPHHKLVKLY
ncbi:MAG: hypothetical protein A2504_14905 [Bdellovibrionales bacterium RIFOXYD12_FULL_39_22]|nr:MAG: hypothetical protein A2385_10370 [Bdellovibrionales bacterium RIFOXYB1_FULL_39_21]OFZ40865.1 MAG: hypothetical protein A2485_17530 [Bdellovibrionales bacterium RIFOXYC12_FULL_39_17]OFZ44406.1 MAG: hypothetical protein A2404_11140 [Bdellovibrionales bacterium RIFOXYC1_FULL_39_130]OFZ72635.1 MAG: hypothetical protein A2451_14225 [Bdellovibrionales bacterium RIFOXYC2_FULL_39_8]OFZ74153.1 MAG: hypothetical protein A2560_03805 [Bdellovibrionales bacterium RIFOXYD1_FULL_39_84]OFZ92002.1 MAG: